MVEYKKLIRLLLIGSIMCMLLWTGYNLFQLIMTKNEGAIGNFDYVVSNGRPTVLYKGNLYQYETDIGWELLVMPGKVKQVISSEDLEYLDDKGKIHCEGYLKSVNDLLNSKEHISSLTGLHIELSKQICEINQKKDFKMINGPVHGDFMALLDNNTIMHYNGNEFQYYNIDEEVSMLSGNKILTTDGNVYELSSDENTSVSLIQIAELQLLHDDGNIIHIDGNAATSIGVTNEGKVVIWSIYNTPDVSEWDNIITAVHGGSFVAALTCSGKVLFKHDNEALSRKAEKIVWEWTDIIDITAYYGGLYAIDKYGNCYGVDMNSSVRAEKSA